MASGIYTPEIFFVLPLPLKNEPVKFGGGFAEVNYMEIPHELTGVKTRTLILIGKFLPTNSHKIGATFGPLVKKLVRGAFDPPGRRPYDHQRETAVAEGL